jgi:hypothetical protein
LFCLLATGHSEAHRGPSSHPAAASSDCECSNIMALLPAPLLSGSS